LFIIGFNRVKEIAFHTESPKLQGVHPNIIERAAGKE
jgi:hypothetical protein